MSVRAVLLGILGWGLLAILTACFLLFIFDPIDARHFLLDAEYAETVIPIARFLGVLGSILLTVLYVLGHRKKQREVALGRSEEENRRHPTRWETFKHAFLFLFTAFLGYMIFYDSARTVIAMVMHHRAERYEFSAPFRIERVVRQKVCNGVIASNKEFYDDKICGVTWDGSWSLYDGQDVMLIGRRSEYGFMVERYELPDPDPTVRSSASAQPAGRLPELQKVFQRCVTAPANAPQPFQVDFQIVVDGKGEIQSMRVLSFRSDSSPAYQKATQSIISGFKACSHFRDVPAGTYALPVVVIG